MSVSELPPGPETDAPLAARAFARISGAEDTVPPEEGRNGLREVASIALTKVADGLIDPKLVLSWLLTALGAPAAYAGALVPIREAGALLPQIGLAAWLARMRHRRWMWAAGALVQGLAALSIAGAALLLDGAAAGLAICGALAVLALARAACSVSFKDVLGRTVAKTRRGAVTGLAGSVASLAVVVFALLLMSGLMQDRGPVIAAIALAGLCWIAAALTFSTVEEPAAEDAGQAPRIRFLSVLRGDAMLRRFILARGLLVSTALAPPYLVVLAGQGGEAVLGRLGALVLASALASFISSYVWGRAADRSSRLVLAASGLAAAGAVALALVLDATGLFTAHWAGPAVLFLLMIAYHGVRQARSVYLVDMAEDAERAAYTAVANTSIGTILLVAGLFGGAASAIAPEWALAGYGVMAVLGAAVAFTLREVEGG